MKQGASIKVTETFGNYLNNGECLLILLLECFCLWVYQWHHSLVVFLSSYPFQSHDARKASLCNVSIGINPFLPGWFNLTKQVVHWPSVCTFSTPFFFLYKYPIFPPGVFVQQSKALLVANQWYFKEKLDSRSVATSPGLHTTPWQVIHLQFCHVSVAVAVCYHPLIRIHSSGWKRHCKRLES